MINKTKMTGSIHLVYHLSPQCSNCVVLMCADIGPLTPSLSGPEYVICKQVFRLTKDSWNLLSQ